MTKIKAIYAEEIFDSRGDPTIEASVELSDGTITKSSVASGSSKEAFEAYELRDNDPNRFKGRGVLKAVTCIAEVIAPALMGVEISNQREIDKLLIALDGTQNKSRLGANSILAVSQATVKAGALVAHLPLPVYIRTLAFSKELNKKIPIPIFNILEGGRYASNNLDIQEFLIIPASSKDFKEALKIGVTVYHALREILVERNLSTLSAEEGGFAPEVSSNQEAFNLIKQTIERAVYQFSYDVFLGIDACAGNFKTNNGYKLIDREIALKTEEMISFYDNFVSEFSLIYIEDPFEKSDKQGWKTLYDAISQKVLIVGDDLTTTNPYRVQSAIDEKIINALVIKLNQIGTVTEAIDVCQKARMNNLKIVVSQRNSECMDGFIADFAVGVEANYVKFGAPARERVIKYNRLL